MPSVHTNLALQSMGIGGKAGGGVDTEYFTFSQARRKQEERDLG